MVDLLKSKSDFTWIEKYTIIRSKFPLKNKTIVIYYYGSKGYQMDWKKKYYSLSYQEAHKLLFPSIGYVPSLCRNGLNWKHGIFLHFTKMENNCGLS